MANLTIVCERCEKTFEKRSDRITKHNYCSRQCAKGPREQITKPCQECGKTVTRVKSQMLEHVFCGLRCSRLWLSRRMEFANEGWNKEKMTFEVRSKLRSAKLGKGEGKTYEKTFGVHTHRVVAEQKIGRKLKPGEVVHHEDENIRNNHPDNLKVFASQAEHAAYHKNKQYGNIE